MAQGDRGNARRHGTQVGKEFTFEHVVPWHRGKEILC